MFPGNQLAQSARDDSLNRVMSIIDSHGGKGCLPREIIQEVVDQQEKVYPWLTWYQIDGLHKRRSAEFCHAKQRDEDDVEEGDELFQYKGDSDDSSYDKEDIYTMADDFNDGVGLANDFDNEAGLFTAAKTVKDDATFSYSVGQKKGSTDKAKMAMKNRQQLLIDEISDT